MLSLSSKFIPPLVCNLFILTEPLIDEEMKKSFKLPVSSWFSGAIKVEPLTPILSEPFLNLCPDAIVKVKTCLSGVVTSSSDDDWDPVKYAKS